MPNENPNNISIHSFQHSKKILGSSRVCIYLNDYLLKIKAKTVITEHEYIDKDFIIDYAKFYSRTFKKIKKTTTRYHFFNENITREEFVNGLARSENNDLQEKLQRSYLGFVVKKPIESPNPLRQKLIGRTLLKTYDRFVGRDERQYIKNLYSASLCGINLDVNSLHISNMIMVLEPAQQQHAGSHYSRSQNYSDHKRSLRAR
jgi:hypothetical protein